MVSTRWTPGFSCWKSDGSDTWEPPPSHFNFTSRNLIWAWTALHTAYTHIWLCESAQRSPSVYISRICQLPEHIPSTLWSDVPKVQGLVQSSWHTLGYLVTFPSVLSKADLWGFDVHSQEGGQVPQTSELASTAGITPTHTAQGKACEVQAKATLQACKHMVGSSKTFAYAGIKMLATQQAALINEMHFAAAAMLLLLRSLACSNCKVVAVLCIYWAAYQ